MDKFQTFLSNFFTVSDLSVDERRKRILLSLCIVISIPVITVFALIDLVKGRIVEGLVILMACIILIIVQILFRRLKDMTVVYRLSAFLVLILLGYEISIGGGRGFAFLWFYFFPMLLLFIFGKKEGAAWVLVSIASIVLLMFMGLGGYQYSSPLSIRFFITYIIVAIISYAVESSRNFYYTELSNEKKSLEEVLQRVKTLSGLLPICAVCKKIRDDKGYWNQIEKYIHQHSEAEFSHGICPECANRLYPEIDLEAEFPSKEEKE